MSIILSHNQEIYPDECIQVTKHLLFYDGGACRIESSPLIYSAN